MKKHTTTIRDVAAAAGVSAGTVSKYVNGTQRFSPVVEASIKCAIEELGYRSNPLAQSMITGKTRIIGVSVLDLGNPHFSRVIKGANRVALERGYTLLLVDLDEDPGRERPLLEALGQRVDGLIVSSRMADGDAGWVAGIERPMVLLGDALQLALPSVGADDYRGAYMLAHYLISLGHRAVGYLGFARSRSNTERLAGIQACLAAHGLALTVFAAEAPTAMEGERSVPQIMSGAQRPDALVCYNDLMAMGFMRAAQSQGFHIPADLSVAGFDNIEFGAYAGPALTTVDLQSEEVGRLAMKKLLAAIEGEVATGLAMKVPQLILRSSTMRRP